MKRWRPRTTKSLHPRSPVCIAMRANAQAAEYNVGRRNSLKSATAAVLRPQQAGADKARMLSVSGIIHSWRSEDLT